MDEALPGGRFAKPVRRGDTVRRRRGTTNTHALLRHFERVGFDLAPRLVGVSDKFETVSLLPGDTGYPPLSEKLRSDQALVSVAGAIRRHSRGCLLHPGEPRGATRPGLGTG